MRIGIDFDNTIVCYDGVFHKAALERRLIPEDWPEDKNAVRDYLNHSGQNDAFTQLQGHVYGTRMDLAKLYDGFADFAQDALARGHQLFVVSHKTRYPILGEKHDLHQAARNFLKDNAPDLENLFFELTKEEKAARARELALDVFIDDLPEILQMEGFSPATRKILFDPLSRHAGSLFERCCSWSEVSALLLGPA